MDGTYFNERRVIVTGAAQGIGASIAQHFLRAGATVFAADLSAEKLAGFQAELTSDEQERFHPYELDVRSAPGVCDFLESVGTGGAGLDVLVNNAGRASWGGIDEISIEEWNDVLALDLTSVFLTTKFALPLLERSRGNIVNVASISGLFADHRMTAYNAAKAGVIHLTRSLAYDLGPRGIRVNAVAPGPVQRLNAPSLMDVDAVRNGWLDNTPLRRIAEPADIARAVAYIASSDAQHVTGVVLPVDGGLTLGSGQPDLTSVMLERQAATAPAREPVSVNNSRPGNRTKTIEES